MPLNTLRKDRSEHFSGRAARLASCIVCLSVKNKSVKLPFDANKQKYHVTCTCNKNKKFDWLFMADPI